MYYIYVLECRDGSLYTGVAADLCRRMRQHARRGPDCARYTRSHPVQALRGLWRTAEKGDALRLEYAVKQLPRQRKLALLARPGTVAELFPQLAACYEPLAGITLEMCLEGNAL